MSLRSKFLYSVLILVVALSILMSFGNSRGLLLVFETFEKHFFERNMIRFSKLLEMEKTHLFRDANEIALELARTREPAEQMLAREERHEPSTFVAALDIAAQKVTGYRSDAAERMVPLSPSFSRDLAESVRRLPGAGKGKNEGENPDILPILPAGGLLKIGRDRYVVVVAPPPEGGDFAVAVGYELKDFLLSASRTLEEKFQLLDPAETPPVFSVEERLLREDDTDGIHVSFVSDADAVVYCVLADMAEPDDKILVSNTKQRYVYGAGLKTLANRYAWIFLFGAVVLALVLFIFDKLILYRLQKLQKIAEEISGKWQVNLRIPLEGNDEITRLSMSFNSMIEALDTLILNVPDPLILSDSGGEILLANAAARNLLGVREEEELTGRTLESLLSEKGKNAGPGGDLLKSENVFEVNVCRADGNPVPVEIHKETLTFGNASFTLSIVHDLTERKIIEDRLVKMAFYDSQTGLPNRHYFWDELEKELRNLRTIPHYTFCVAFVNMDKFKLVNEQVGPRNADLVIIEAAKRITGIIAGFATSFRLSGDEFGIIVRGTNSKDYVKSLLLRIQRLLNTPVSIEGKTVFPSASFGVVLGIQSSNTADQILALGSDALIRGKKHGIGTITFLTAEEGTQKIDRNLQHNLLTVRANMQKALASSEFVAYYQPLYQLSPQILAGFETLARWAHPEDGILPPGAFVSQAEETGLITEIDKQIISQAIHTAKRWSETYSGTSFMLSANASGASFKDPGFVPFVCDRIREESLDPRYFVLEVTEGIFIENLENAKEKLNLLREFGVRIALDDFGTGYSSLQYVSQLPVNYIKIDKSFIDQLFISEKNSLMVRSIINMARDLNFDVVAEGVENEDQVHWLAENNASKGQGYFFSRPVPLSEAENILADAKFFEDLQ